MTYLACTAEHAGLQDNWCDVSLAVKGPKVLSHMPSLELAEYIIFNIYLDWRVTAAPVDTDTGKYNQETVDTAALHCTVCTQATVLISGPYKVSVSTTIHCPLLPLLLQRCPRTPTSASPSCSTCPRARTPPRTAQTSTPSRGRAPRSSSTTASRVWATR